jgi:hypothetical protein
MAKKVCCIVYSIVNNEPFFLLMRRNNWWNGWEFIRGDVLENENPIDSANRAVNDCTGIVFECLNTLPFSYSYDYLKGLEKSETEVSCFLCKASSMNVLLSGEHDYYKWLDYDSAMKLLDFVEQKKLLETAKKFI